MESLENSLKGYLSEVTGFDVSSEPLLIRNLPFFFARQYALFRLIIGQTIFTGIFLKEIDEFNPTQFIKHMRQASLDDSEDLCVVAESLPPYVRKRLIEKGISFVIPKVQMYLPSLGMELRLRSKQHRSMTVERFSPATQVVLIYWLLGRINDSVTPLELSKRLNYSSMTMSRSLDELESLQIAKVSRRGKERLLEFTEERKQAWEYVLPMLRDPVSHTVRIFEQDIQRSEMLPAGISVLSGQSMLNEPSYNEYAVSRNVWKVMKEKRIEIIPIEEPGTSLIQVWRYDPKALEVNGCVDPFSLYLSLQNTNDERIEMALEEMMERYL